MPALLGAISMSVIDGYPPYTSVFSGPVGIDKGYVTLADGDIVTIVRTNNILLVGFGLLLLGGLGLRTRKVLN